MSRLVTRTSIVLACISITVSTGTAAAASCWRPPVAASVTDPFREPSCAWCPGNRGIEFGTGSGAPVRAVASGHVSYAGTIAGTVYVVVLHADGKRVTYANLADESFDRDDVVIRGQLVGHTAGRFHLGLRDGDRYIDPAPYLGRLVRRARLIPADGRAGNAAPPPRLTCRARRV